MKKMLIVTGTALLIFACNSKSSESAAASEGSEVKTPVPVEIGDTALVAIIKKSLAVFSHKDADNGFADYTDDVRFYYSNGDSLIGKRSIINFWKDRFAKWYDSITVRDDIWLPVKVNSGERPQPGNYVLLWFNTDLKFKNGKKISTGVHDVYHLNTNKKVDRVYRYIDFALLKEAMLSK